MAGTAILSYLAGIIDGEGWISIGKNKPRTKTCSPQHFLRIGVSNTSEKLMLWLEENFGGRVLLIDRNRRQQEKVKKWKTCYQWDIVSNSAFELLQKVSPLLIIKSDKAKLALRFS